MNLTPLQVGFVNSVCMALLGALAGAVIGWIMGIFTAKN
jgi:ABC-type amino acid transport system permease subunit